MDQMFTDKDNFNFFKTLDYWVGKLILSVRWGNVTGFIVVGGASLHLFNFKELINSSWMLFTFNFKKSST